MSGRRSKLRVAEFKAVRGSAVLPRFCKLVDFPQIPGLFLPESKPSAETLRKWRRDGTLVMREMGSSLFVDVHATLKRHGVEIG